MLKQEQETISETPASQVRVTPEEMAKAMAAIEARKQQEAHQKATTLTLGEAVQDLALDTTPEELFTEVKRQRAERANAREAAEQAERAKADAFQEAEERRQAALRMAQPIQSQSTGWQGGWSGSRNRPKRNRWLGIVIGCLVVSNVFHGVFSGASHVFSSGASHIFSHAAPVTTQSLASLPEGVSATCDTTTLRAIKQGKSASEITVTRGEPIEHHSNNNRWEIVKHNGHVYVEVYSSPLSEDALKAGPSIHLYNGDDVGELDNEDAQGQLVRLDTLGWDGKAISGEDWQRITVTSVPLDEFADIEKNP